MQAPIYGSLSRTARRADARPPRAPLRSAARPAGTNPVFARCKLPAGSANRQPARAHRFQDDHVYTF